MYRFLGPKIPIPVWHSHLLRARGLAEEEGISWTKLTKADRRELDTGDSGDRTLLLVHGTGLRTRPGFLGLTQEEYRTLHEHYGGRILAFEHRAIMHGLERNSHDLARALERVGGSLYLDIIGLSRGGLVARMLVEGWEPLRPNIRVRKLVFVGTPNDGTPSARRDRLGIGAKMMKDWRQYVRGIAQVDQTDRSVALFDDPAEIAGFDRPDFVCLGWPMLFGTQDQLPRSPSLQRLNGHIGQRPHPLHVTEYFGVASVFNFKHGAPNTELGGGRNVEDICDWALPQVPNDLVVPTASVYRPAQGANSCGRFPLQNHRLMVLKPSCNATHTGLFRLDAVRSKIMHWLGL
jgi:hypothetical protein